MSEVLLINPNTSVATTRMMAEIVQNHLGQSVTVRWATARTGVSMIVSCQELEDSATQVQSCWREAAGQDWAGVIVACFGDPGVDWLRSVTATPVIGICEAAMLDAGSGGRSFGIATTTPDLAPVITGQAARLHLASQYTGLRATAGDPCQLVAKPCALERALADAVTDCIDKDQAQAVVIGGGPLGQAAIGLADRFSVPLISPLVSAANWLQRCLPMPLERVHDLPEAPARS